MFSKDLRENKVSSEEIYDGQVVHLYKDIAQLPNGKTAVRETIRHIGAVGIVPLTGDGKVIMEKQYRYPLGRVVTEIPAGKLNCKTEDKLAAAKRELEEETGLVADEWIPLGDYIPAAAYCDELITLYLAKGLHQGTRNLDEDEFLCVERVHIDKLVVMVMSGEIPDAKTQIAILKVKRILDERKK